MSRKPLNFSQQSLFHKAAVDDFIKALEAQLLQISISGPILKEPDQGLAFDNFFLNFFSVFFL